MGLFDYKADLDLLDDIVDEAKKLIDSMKHQDEFDTSHLSKYIEELEQDLESYYRFMET